MTLSLADLQAHTRVRAVANDRLYYRVGDEGYIVGKYLTTHRAQRESIVVVHWDNYVGKTDEGIWTPIKNIELVDLPVSDAELSEVYEILGVSPPSTTDRFTNPNKTR